MKYMNNNYGNSEIFTGKVPMNLQFHADGGDDGGAGGDDGGSGGDGGASDGAGGSGSDKPKTFDEILAEQEHQAEFDRRVQKAINTALSNEREKMQLLADEKVSEAEKLAKMTKEEKAAYLQQKKEKELADKEADLTKRELKAEARETLSQRELPEELSDLLDYKDADSCKASIDAVEKIFNKALENAVEKRLKGGKPLNKAPEDGLSEKEKLVKVINDPKTTAVDRIAAKNRLYSLKED